MMNDQFPIQEYTRGRFVVSTEPDLLDGDVIVDYLTNQSYWAMGTAREIIEKAMRFSLCWGVYDTAAGYAQIGFCRAISDFATFAYLADVFILPDYRRRGLGKWLVQCALAHPQLQTLRRWTLDTRDAQALYTRFGFKPNPAPEQHLIYRPNESNV